MNTWSNLSFSQKIKWRIRILWTVLVIMIIYMITVSELGGGDSRIMTPLADMVSGILFFGGFIAIGCRIHYNRKLLNNRKLLKQKYLDERDERNRYLHDKSGGVVVDLLLLALLFTTVTAALFNMTAFHLSLAILLLTLLLKGSAYWLFKRGL